MKALSIERVVVRNDRIACDVAVASDAPHATTPALARLLLEKYPSLADHACVNRCGDRFVDIVDDTSLPHVLEHLAIDFQVRYALDAPETLFVGTTQWIDEAAGRARVELSFSDDLVALRALRDAERALNELVS